MDWTKDIRLMIFDLDGTLYQDENFIGPYLTYLFREEADAWREEADRILNGRHPLKIGHFFSRSLKSGVRHEGGTFTGRYDWDGNEADVDADGIRLPEGDAHYVGDAWGVLGALAGYNEVPADVRSRAFLSVRADMIERLNSVTPRAGLVSAIRGLTTVPHKLLMTNSPEEAALNFVAKLGLENVFDQVIFGGNKPDGLTEFLPRYMEEHGISPSQVVSIGDHAWNDLYPVKRLGGRTVWISPYESHDEEQWDLRLRTLDELEDFLLRFEG